MVSSQEIVPFAGYFRAMPGGEDTVALSGTRPRCFYSSPPSNSCQINAIWQRREQHFEIENSGAEPAPIKHLHPTEIPSSALDCHSATLSRTTGYARVTGLDRGIRVAAKSSLTIHRLARDPQVTEHSADRAEDVADLGIIGRMEILVRRRGTGPVEVLGLLVRR